MQRFRLGAARTAEPCRRLKMGRYGTLLFEGARNAFRDGPRHAAVGASPAAQFVRTYTWPLIFGAVPFYTPLQAADMTAQIAPVR